MITKHSEEGFILCLTDQGWMPYSSYQVTEAIYLRFVRDKKADDVTPKKLDHEKSA